MQLVVRNWFIGVRFIKYKDCTHAGVSGVLMRRAAGRMA